MMHEGRRVSVGLGPRWAVFGGWLALILVVGCGYMPRTANQMGRQLDLRDQKLREEMSASKQELAGRIQAAEQRLSAVDGKLVDLEASLRDMRSLEVTMQQVRADMLSVRNELASVRAELKACVRGEVGDALINAGKALRPEG